MYSPRIGKGQSPLGDSLSDSPVCVSSLLSRSLKLRECIGRAYLYDTYYGHSPNFKNPRTESLMCSAGPPRNRSQVTDGETENGLR